MATYIDLNDSNFSSLIEDIEQGAIVSFTSNTCAPCQILKPILNELVTIYGNKIVIGVLDITANPKVTKAYHIRSLPTTLYFHAGAPFDKSIGSISKEALIDKIENKILPLNE